VAVQVEQATFGRISAFGATVWKLQIESRNHFALKTGCSDR